MPLPSALAARLARRGLISNNGVSEEKSTTDPFKNLNNTEVEEEVIAENYDDQENQGNTINRIHIDKNDDVEEELDEHELKKIKFRGHPGCPNKCNIFHECSLFCKEFWKEGHKEPDPKYLKRKAAMLVKHPLPSHWKEIYDPGTGRHYYWETDSDAVSWLPPSHPRAVISESAAHLREEQMDGKRNYKDMLMEVDEEAAESESDFSSEDENEDLKRIEKKKRQEVMQIKRAKGRTKMRENDLDPMDPASYSDIPRGDWSDGLYKHNEAKTGVDVTASGPLYQMRPYPNPGAVLRANRSKPPADDEEEDSA